MDFTELLIEVRNRSGLPFVIEQGTRIVQAAERFLQRRLKDMNMETVATLATDEDGIAPLPSDFLQAAGDDAVNITGNEIYTDTVNGTVQFRYYASLPSVETNTTNWLMTLEPEIYVQAVLAQAYVVAGDADKVTTHRALLDEMLGDLRRQDVIAKYANRRVSLEMPV